MLPNSLHEAYSIGATTDIPFMSDGAPHTAVIRYEPGIMKIFMDDLVTPALEVSVDLANTLGLNSGEAFVGFTAGTGAGYENHDILNWTFQEGLEPTPPTANADGPYTIWTGAPLILNASGSTDPHEQIVSYMWDLDDDGVFETDAVDQPFFVVDYEDMQNLGLAVGGMHDIHLKVTDSTGLFDTDSSSLRIVPEPATLSLLTLGGLALVRRRKRGMCK